MTKIITKYSGEREPFDVSKFQRSIRRAGANESQVRDLTRKVLESHDLNTTKEIYSFAFHFLKRKNPPIAARYSLRSAITQLGPSGFPFEQLVGQIFKHLGYEVQTDQILNGKCVRHEVDLVLQKKGKHFMGECKFHHEPHLNVDVKIPLYVKARFEDIQANHTFDGAWVITNTKFSTAAIEYSKCAGLHLLGWSYPGNDSLERVIDRLGLHPITAMTTLSNKQKQLLLEQKIVLCKNMAQERGTLKSIGLSEQQIEDVIREGNTMCELGAINHEDQ